MSGRGSSQKGLLQSWLLDEIEPSHSGAGSSCSRRDRTLCIKPVNVPSWMEQEARESPLLAEEVLEVDGY